ncbi:MAG: putative membrane protein [Colwellia sp.]|jgi:uncharacterized membrane protein
MAIYFNRLHTNRLIPIPLNSGTASIGGAGKFDGIVISGFIALLLS